jgi:hypothetical protein
MGGGRAGGAADGGARPDGGPDGGQGDAGSASCATVQLDPVLGSFALNGSTTVLASGPLPAVETLAHGLHNGRIYAVTRANTLHDLGMLPSLALGPPIVDIRSESDRDGGVFVSGFIASNGLSLLSGYTKASVGVMFQGHVSLVQPGDGGVEYVPARGNYSAAGLISGLNVGPFIVNGLGLGTAMGNGLFALRPGAPSSASALATFPDAFGGSGVTAIAANGVLVAGNFRTDSSSIVRALPPSAYLFAVASGSTITYSASTAPVVAEGSDVAEVTTFRDDAIVVRGGFDSMFNAFTTRVERVPLMLSGSGVETVTVGTAVPLMTNGGLSCTRVFAAFGSGSELYLGLNDRLGRRLVKVGP